MVLFLEYLDHRSPRHKSGNSAGAPLSGVISSGSGSATVTRAWSRSPPSYTQTRADVATLSPLPIILQTILGLRSCSTGVATLGHILRMETQQPARSDIATVSAAAAVLGAAAFALWLIFVTLGIRSPILRDMPRRSSLGLARRQQRKLSKAPRCRARWTTRKATRRPSLHPYLTREERRAVRPPSRYEGTCRTDAGASPTTGGR